MNRREFIKATALAGVTLAVTVYVQIVPKFGSGRSAKNLDCLK